MLNISADTVDFAIDTMVEVLIDSGKQSHEYYLSVATVVQALLEYRLHQKCDNPKGQGVDWQGVDAEIRFCDTEVVTTEQEQVKVEDGTDTSTGN